MAHHLRTVFLICMLPICIRSTKAENFENLASIINFLDRNYNVGQFAAAINVERGQCEQGPLNSLTTDSSENICNIIKNDNNPVYMSERLIAAGVRKNPPAHSEYLLLNPVHNSPLTNLLKRRENGCVVFYTLNSPCIDTCLGGIKYNIILGIDELRNYQGMKAFVFKNIWKHDQNRPELTQHLRAIADRVPLFRCRNGPCTLCGQPDSNAAINEQCLTV